MQTAARVKPYTGATARPATAMRDFSTCQVSLSGSIRAPQVRARHVQRRTALDQTGIETKDDDGAEEDPDGKDAEREPVLGGKEWARHC
jgi:hypothetical protein